MTVNSYQAAASNNPVWAGQINQLLVDHNVQVYAYDGARKTSTSNTPAPTATYGTNTGGLTGKPQMIGQAITPAVTGSISRIELLLAASTATGGASGADVLVTIQTDNSGVPSGSVLATAYIPLSWLTTTVQVISIPITLNLTSGTKYWVVINGSTGSQNFVKASSGGATTVAKVSTNAGSTWSSGATQLWMAVYTNDVDGLMRGIQADASAFQQALTYQMVTLDAVMSGVALPTATITVDGGTQGFPASGTFQVDSSTGRATVTYTGRTATTFTGCSGGTGTLATGSVCAGSYQPTNAYGFTAYQSSVLGNLLVPPDGDLELGLGSWTTATAAPTLAISTAQFLYGSQSMLITTTSALASAIATASVFSVAGSTSYALQASVLAATSNLRNVRVSINWYDAAGVFISASAGTLVPTSQTVWANPVLIATSPPTAINAQVAVAWVAGVSGDSYYVDGIGLTQGTVVPAWSPGGLGQGTQRTLTYLKGSLASAS